MSAFDRSAPEKLAPDRSASMNFENLSTARLKFACLTVAPVKLQDLSTLPGMFVIVPSPARRASYGLKSASERSAPLKVCTDEGRQDADLAHVRTGKARGIDAVESQAREDCRTQQRGARKIGAREISTRDGGTVETSARKVNALRVGIRKVDAVEVGAGEQRALEIETGKIEVRKVTRGIVHLLAVLGVEERLCHLAHGNIGRIREDRAHANERHAESKCQSSALRAAFRAFRELMHQLPVGR